MQRIRRERWTEALKAEQAAQAAATTTPAAPRVAAPQLSQAQITRVRGFEGPETPRNGTLDLDLSGCWYRCRAPLLCALGSLGAGVWVLVPVQGAPSVCAAAGRRCCVRLGAWVLVPLQGAAAVCANYEPRAKKPRQPECNDSNAIWGPCWRNFTYFYGT